MKTNKFIFFFLFISASLSAYSQNNEKKIVTKVNFTVSATGEKTFNILIPQGTKTVEAKIINQTQMLKVELIGPTNTVLCRNSTWSNLSNWQKPLKCSASIANNKRQKSGNWKVKIIGAVQKSKVDQIKSVSGTLIVYVNGHFIENHQLVSEKKSDTKEFSFHIAPKGEVVFTINVPKTAKRIKVEIDKQTQMLKVELAGPTQVVLCKNSTWSNLPNWQKPLKCSASVVNNSRQKPGNWKVKIIGAVQKSKIDQVKSISGKLKVTISF